MVLWKKMKILQHVFWLVTIVSSLVEKLEAFHYLVIENRGSDANALWHVDANTLHFIGKMLETIDL